MADNKLLLRRDTDEDFLSEDDPLAELARIVGFEPKPEIKPHAVLQRREPEFDLEDELLKEFEQYEAPEPVAVRPPLEEPVFIAAPAAAAVPQFEPEPALEAEAEVEYIPDVEPDHAPDPAPFVLQEVERSVEIAAGHDLARPQSHPVFDLEDEILREFAAFDARQVSTVESSAAPVTAEVIRQEPSFEQPVAVEQALQPATEETDPFLLFTAPEVAIEPSHDDRDVHDEQTYVAAPEQAEDFEAQNAIEGDMAATPGFVAPEALEPEDDAFAPFQEEPEAEAHFTAEDASYWADVEQESDARNEAAIADIVLDSDDVSDAAFDQHFSAAHFHAEPLQQPVDIEDASPSTFLGGYDDAALPAPPVEPIPMHSVSPVADESQAYRSPQPVENDYGLDALLAEVERYPVGDTTGRWGVQAKAATPDDLIQPPVAGIEDVSAEHSTDEPKFDVVEQAPLAYAPHHAVTEEIAAADDVPFDENSFELDFGDIELDLSELHEDVTAGADALSEIADADIDATDVTSPDIGRAQAYAMRVSEPVPQEDYSSLPFDPSQIVLEEDAVEVLAEMDVPEIPVVHDEEKPAPHAEYDLDIDADMANLFGAASQKLTQPQPCRQVSQTHGDIQFAAAQAPAAPISPMELDEFERALEEDFRRSFAENRNVGTPDRVALTPAYRTPIKAARGGRTWALLAGSAIAIVLFGGAGVWAFMSGDTKILASSEPKIILADTDPVKVVPDDKGGRQVPNQNKAVYDRVSGATTEVAKQESLVSSTEEPVDVVQRTLMPENLPMDDDSMAAVTPTEDTIDPRLLPEAERERVTTTSRVTSGVSPRKVKTMVVKSDGSLVAREETAEDIQQQATNDAELMKIARKAAEDAAKPVDTSGDDIAKAIESVPERLAPADENAAVAEVPVKPVETVKVTPVEQEVAKSVTQPVVTETDVAKVDPIDAAKVEKQPLAEVNSAETPVSTETPVAAEEKPADTADVKTPVERSIPAADSQAVDTKTADTQTADAKTTDSQAVDNSAVTAAANAEVVDAPVRKVKTSKIMPVPENRPVDQPVNVVGTVSDQGNVQDNAAKQQEVASIDPVKKPAETTALPAGGYVIQIASLPSETDAQNSYSKLSAKFANVIGGRGVDIKRAEIKNKGTYYRVRIPAGSKQEAQELCSQYKKAGGSCLVSK